MGHTSTHFPLKKIGVGAVLTGLWALTTGVLTAWNPGLLRSLELQTHALFLQLRGPVAPPDNIVILAIDEDSITRGRDSRDLKELESIRSQNWRRTAYAEAISRLMAAGARAVAVDVVFDLPGERPADNEQLRSVLTQYAGRVVLAAFHASSEASGGGLEQLVYPDVQFQTEPGVIGFTNFQTEPNGQIHRFTSTYLDRIDPDLRQSAVLEPFDRASLKAANLPFSPPKGDYIFFYGRQNTFPTISFWNVLYSRNWELLKQRGVFKDKLVLIGPTAAILQDIHPTPVGRVPGVEIHANAIATLLQNRSLVDPFPDSQARGLAVGLAVALTGWGVGVLFRRSFLRLLIALGIAGTWMGAGYAAFVFQGVILPVLLPVGGITLSGLSYLGAGALRDQLEKLRLRRTLERYVAAPIVQEILSQPEDYRSLLQGRKLKAAVLFCDIRGFTTLSYKLPPEELVTQLNTYLDAMVNAVISCRGTIDKFIGDAVMAEFGSPVSQGEVTDAMNAIYAALAMRQALVELRQHWQQEGKPQLYQGIGINYGEMIAGNIGSIQRLEYTAIGDAVNVASRVEGLTKHYRTDLLITESLYQLVHNKIEAICVGSQALRGREETTINLYSVIGLKGCDRTLYDQIHAELGQLLDTKHSN